MLYSLGKKNQKNLVEVASTPPPPYPLYVRGLKLQSIDKLCQLDTGHPCYDQLTGVLWVSTDQCHLTVSLAQM